GAAAPTEVHRLAAHPHGLLSRPGSVRPPAVAEIGDLTDYLPSWLSQFAGLFFGRAPVTFHFGSGVCALSIHAAAFATTSGCAAATLFVSPTSWERSYSSMFPTNIGSRTAFHFPKRTACRPPCS